MLEIIVYDHLKILYFCCYILSLGNFELCSNLGFCHFFGMNINIIQVDFNFSFNFSWLSLGSFKNSIWHI